MSAKYTFLLCTYKVRYLPEALDSIQKQSFGDFRVIVSDDCSPDNIYDVVAPFLADSRFSYRRNEKNIGSKSLVAHWNMLLDQTDSEFVIIACDDDTYHADFLKEIDLLTRRYPETNLFRARVQRYYEGALMDLDPLCEEYTTQLKYLYNSFVHGHIHCIGNYVFRRKLLLDIGRFHHFQLAWYSDDRAWIEMSANGVGSTSEVYFTMRNSDINISSRKQCTPEIATAKVQACKDFLLWYNEFSKVIKRNDNLYETRLFNKAHAAVRNYVYKLINQYIELLPLKEYVSARKFLYFEWYTKVKPNRLKLIFEWMAIQKRKQ